MRYEFQPDALDEYEEAARFYAECQDGLELRFISCVEAAFKALSADPFRGRCFDGEIRRWLVHVFPYAILYAVEADYIVIIAVMHCHREPGYWHSRINVGG